MSRIGRHWSEEEVAQLMRVYRRIAAVHKYRVWQLVAAEMPGRNAAQCVSRVRYQLEGRKTTHMPPGMTHELGPRRSIPPQVLADAIARRSLAPRSLTAAFCGDPLPGWSALDRVETVERAKITLAGGPSSP